MNSKPEIILASASPRRLEILRMFGLDPTVKALAVDESCDPSLTPAETVEYLSKIKGERVALEHPDALVVSADTVVSHGGKILGKPHSEKEAYEMLSSFSANAHEVFTGYTVFYKGKSFTRSVVTRVLFKKLSDEEIYAYIATKEPFDKAGAYGAQGRAAVFVDRIDGDFFNVVGFPLADFYTAVREQFSVNLW